MSVLKHQNTCRDILNIKLDPRSDTVTHWNNGVIDDIFFVSDTAPNYTPREPNHNMYVDANAYRLPKYEDMEDLINRTTEIFLERLRKIKSGIILGDVDPPE
jgi:hypothetical protein